SLQCAARHAESPSGRDRRWGCRNRNGIPPWPWSPGLPVGAHVELERPGVARLAIELPIGLRDRGRIHELVRLEPLERVRARALLDAFAYESGVDAGVDDEMRDMDVLRPELPRHALGDGAQAELGARKRRIADAAANARGRAGEEDAALAARQHQAG